MVFAAPATAKFLLRGTVYVIGTATMGATLTNVERHPISRESEHRRLLGFIMNFVSQSVPGPHRHIPFGPARKSLGAAGAGNGVGRPVHQEDGTTHVATEVIDVFARFDQIEPHFHRNAIMSKRVTTQLIHDFGVTGKTA